MRDLTKNLFSFSWAMSLFGVRQLGSLLDPREAAKGAPGTAQAFDRVTEAMRDQFGDNLRQTFDAGDKIQEEIVNVMFGALGVRPARPAEPGRPGGHPGTGSPGREPRGHRQPHAEPDRSPSGLPHPPPIFAAHSDAGEQVMITYTRGEGRFSEDKRYIALSNQIFNLDGAPNGLHEGVWEALFSSPLALLAKPAPPTGPMNEPVGPVPSEPVSANTIAKWTHADGSSISSVGPAVSHLIPLSDGSFLFLVITAQIITEGTGRFSGAKGLTQSLGATWVPAGVDLFSPDGPATFPATTLDTFKFLDDAHSGPAGGGPQHGGGGSPGTGHGGSHTGTQGGGYQGGYQGAAPAVEAQVCTRIDGAPDASHYVEVLGSKMHYLDVGEGPVTIFLHGNPTWSYLWRNVLPNVGPRARCIAPDLIGMGLSDKPDVGYSFFDQVRYFEAFVDALGLDDYALVLHDQGTLIGFYHAMRFEERIRGLAFMEGLIRPYTTWDDFPAPLVEPFKAFRDPRTGHKLIVEDNVFIEQQIPGGTLSELSEQTMDCYRLPFLEPESREVILRFVQNLPIDGEPIGTAHAIDQYTAWLRRTDLPKLFLWAEPGLINTETDVEWARDHFKNLKTSFLGPGLHFLQESHPAEIGHEVSRWLGSLR